MSTTRLLCLAIAIAFTLCSCKKEVEIQDNLSPFGAFMGDGTTRTIAEVIQTADEQYLICGTEAVGKNGFEDGYLMKTDKDFNLLWYKNYGAANQDRFESMAVDEEGNIMLVGTTYSFGVSLDTTKEKRNNLFYIVFTDKNGNQIWEKTHQPVNPQSSVNRLNTASKVIYSKNKQFCIAGKTDNYSATENNSYGYVFGINVQGLVLWSRNYYRFPVFDPYSVFEESVDDMVLSEDGDLILLSRRDDSTSYAFLSKVPSTANDHTKNTFTWRGDYSPFIGYPDYSKVMRCRLANAKGGKLVFSTLPVRSIYNSQNGIQSTAQLYFCDENGKIAYSKKFMNYIWNLNLRRQGDRLLISGMYRSVNGQFPCWVSTDLEGNPIAENYLEFASNLSDRINIASLFINSKNEIRAFGYLELQDASQLFMLKFDQNGNLLK